MGQLSKDEVFALAVQRYSDTVFRAAMRNCSCTADAEDVVRVRSISRHGCCGWPSTAATT